MLFAIKIKLPARTKTKSGSKRQESGVLSGYPNNYKCHYYYIADEKLFQVMCN